MVIQPLQTPIAIVRSTYSFRFFAALVVTPPLILDDKMLIKWMAFYTLNLVDDLNKIKFRYYYTNILLLLTLVFGSKCNLITESVICHQFVDKKNCAA